MENKELREKLKSALTTIRNCWSDNNEINYQLEQIETKIMNLINEIA